ncbi:MULTISPECIES: TetR/AcrR family transcriptional regulator [Thermomonosporaceae]|uniref:TetR/AcrR family transcriptional regulator n=1 Tax=Thermomonosporaceae TaxID=2012 RepID=UPI00255AFC31|nr:MULTISPECIES: TetR/AcrR family transcriptional regulator [Thermomonosporaceae]MDL4776749.1 helix-turn-helix domain-containing protein [Actinomadura xylanilytica]
MTTSTRDRIVDAAMELFGRNGYKGTSVVQIEKAAGLTPGAGGIYHHFRSKEAVLAAGIERHLGRVAALRDLRRVFAGVGDLRTELTLTARYALAELDNETELLRIIASEARARPELVGGAVQQLIGATYTGFAGWLRDGAGLAEEKATAVAAVGLGALLSSRLLPVLLDSDPIGVSDDALVETWVEMMHAQLERD